MNAPRKTSKLNTGVVRCQATNRNGTPCGNSTGGHPSGRCYRHRHQWSRVTSPEVNQNIVKLIDTITMSRTDKVGMRRLKERTFEAVDARPKIYHNPTGDYIGDHQLVIKNIDSPSILWDGRVVPSFMSDPELGSTMPFVDEDGTPCLLVRTFRREYRELENGETEIAAIYSMDTIKQALEIAKTAVDYDKKHAWADRFGLDAMPALEVYDSAAEAIGQLELGSDYGFITEYTLTNAAEDGTDSVVLTDTETQKRYHVMLNYHPDGLDPDGMVHSTWQVDQAYELDDAGGVSKEPVVAPEAVYRIASQCADLRTRIANYGFRNIEEDGRTTTVVPVGWLEMEPVSTVAYLSDLQLQHGQSTTNETDPVKLAQARFNRYNRQREH
jgi:hypothetical protein